MDQNSGATMSWSNTSNNLIGTDGTDGFTNTGLIDGNSDCTNTGGCAAKLCKTLSIDGGYADAAWFLPAGTNMSGQAYCLYQNRVVLGLQDGNDRWTSTEQGQFSALEQAFGEFFGGAFPSGKTNTTSARVRCARAIT